MSYINIPNQEKLKIYSGLENQAKQKVKGSSKPSTHFYRGVI